MSKKSDENQVIDDYFRSYCGYGESGFGICGRLSQTTNSVKGEKNVMCMDAGRFRICAYMHLHKLYNHKKQGW